MHHQPGSRGIADKCGEGSHYASATLWSSRAERHYACACLHRCTQHIRGTPLSINHMSWRVFSRGKCLHLTSLVSTHGSRARSLLSCTSPRVRVKPRGQSRLARLLTSRPFQGKSGQDRTWALTRRHARRGRCAVSHASASKNRGALHACRHSLPEVGPEGKDEKRAAIKGRGGDGSVNLMIGGLEEREQPVLK